MKNVTPYLFFAGNCREAMNYYHQVFGGEITFMTFGDAQREACPLALKDKVMHGALQSGNFMLMASDEPTGSKPTLGTAVQLAATCASNEELERVFKKLGDDGKVNFPVHDAFWGARFGVLTDRFGINWMLSFEKPK